MTVLDEAQQAVHGPRQRDYGHPRLNHGCTAALWWAYLQRRMLTPGFRGLDARDVCQMNILQKVSRDANLRKRDNLVDEVGYAYNAELCEEIPCPAPSVEAPLSTNGGTSPAPSATSPSSAAVKDGSAAPRTPCPCNRPPYPNPPNDALRV